MYADLNAISERVPEHPGPIRERVINELERLRTALEAASADSELLAKVEAYLEHESSINLTFIGKTVHPNGPFFAAEDDDAGVERTAPTLAAALLRLWRARMDASALLPVKR